MTWTLGPFTRRGRVLADRSDVSFRCPVLGETVAWAAKDVFNPAAVVAGGLVCLLVRAEDHIGSYAGTSRIGLATSNDGVHFELEPEPVLFPDDDAWRAAEWPGGCEDPRVVESPDGTYICTYTAFEGTKARLFVATSGDLRTWTKHGPAFAGTRHETRWCKSGSVVTEERDGRLVACRVGGRFWMYWGEGTVFAATSDDLVRWEPVEFSPDDDHYVSHDERPWEVHRVPGERVLKPVLSPRPGRFDWRLVEPGPPAVRTTDGIVLLYNGANHRTDGDPSSPPGAYQPGQVLLDPLDPTAVIARPADPFLRVDAEETTGQVDNVCFVEGLVVFNGEWLLYHGMADSTVGCASVPVSAQD